MSSGRARTVIDVIESALGPLDPDTISSVDSISSDKIEALNHEYHEYRASYAPPVHRAGELRPFVPLPYMDTMAHGLNPAINADLRRIVDPEKTIDRVHLHLMYAHSLALPDPLPWILDFTPSSASTEDTKAWFMESIRNYLIYVSYLRPLIDNSIVILAPVEFFVPVYGSDDFTTFRYEIADEVWRKADFSDLAFDKRGLIGAAATAAIAEGERAIRLLINDSITAIMASVEVDASYGGEQFDLYLPYRFWKNVLTELASGSGRLAACRSLMNNPFSGVMWSAPGWTQSRRLDESLLVREIASLDVTDFSLSAKDIIMVREGEEFTEWRNTLRSSLLQARQLLGSSDVGPQAIAEVVSESLASGQSELQRKIAASRTLKAAREGFKGFTVGALSALLLSPFTSPTEDIAKAAASGLALGVVEVAGLRRPSTQVALLQHYLQFSRLSGK